jgi:hypothetical protein
MDNYILLIIFISVFFYIYYRNTILNYNQTNINKYHQLIRSEKFTQNKPNIKLKFGSNFYIGNENKERHHMQSVKQFIDYFLPNIYNYIIVDSSEKSDITIWDIYLEDSSHLSDDEINIIICVENVPHWNFYKHYSKYGEYNDNKIKIYLYNHIDTMVKTDKYISIPLIHNYINYYNNNNITLEPTEYTLFNDKKFCLMINKSKLNPQINETVTILETLGEVDSLSMYPDLLNKSCYHSIELLNVFNKYKFIICYENSYADGYITEKIFNCFFAKTIPIYKGSEKITNYINKNSFINGRDNFIDKIIEIKDNEVLYNNYINSAKISDIYNNENYNQELSIFINNKLKLEYFWSNENKNLNQSSIYIVYFIYINPERNWKLILEGQMNDIKDTNILETNKLFIVISCNDENNIQEAKNIVNSIFINYNHNIEFTIESQNLFEYPGIKKVYDLALINKDKLFIYFHSKGMVFHQNSKRNELEEKLTKNTFKNWQKTISIFKNNSNINKIGLLPSNSGFIWYNFWWARGDYISKLEEPIISEDRYYYEVWLSKVKKYNCDDSYSLLNNSNNCKSFDEVNSEDINKLINDL